MAYFCTVLTEAWREALEHECEPYRMVWSAALNSVTLVRATSEAVEGVGVELSPSLKYSKQVTPLLQHGTSAFTITALCPLNPLACPVALDVYVNTPQWELELAITGTFVGESALVELLHVSSRNGFLVKRHTAAAAPGHGDGLSAPTRKRARVCTVETELTAAQVVSWMRAAEGLPDGAGHGASTTVALPQFLDVPGSSHVLCLREMAFVPRTHAHWSSSSVSGGLLVGPRSTGKTGCVVQLLQGLDPHAAPLAAPPFLRAVNATLVVVPAHLLAQWEAALTAAGLATLVVYNKKTWSQGCTLARLSEVAVVLTTHQYFATVIKKPSVKHKSRMFATRPVAEVAGMNVRFDWLWWRRVVVDEALLLFMRMQGVCARSGSGRHARGGSHTTAVRSYSWWGLQGGMLPTSVPMCALVDMLHMHARGLRSQDKAVQMCDMHAYESCVLALTRPAAPLCTLRERWVYTTLSVPHRQAYDLLRRSGCAPAELLQVCAGDLEPVRQFLTPVRSWMDALPLGLKVLNDYIFSQDIEFTWSNGNDAQEGDGEEGEEWVVDEEGEGVEGEGVVEDEGVEGVRNRIQSMITHALDEESGEMRERRAFFERVTSGLAMNREAAGTCNVCLTNDADCVFVCGHLMCHECVIDLFVAAKKQQHELNEQGYAEVLDGNLAPCPSCRWSVEPHEVFWVHGGDQGRDGSKVDALVRHLKPLVDAGERVVIVTGSSCKDEGVYVTLSHTVCERLMYHGIPSRVLALHMPSCYQSWAWFTAAPSSRGKVLLVYSDQLQGLKLPDVRHMVLLHPALDGVAAQQCVQRHVQECCHSNRTRREEVFMHHFIVRDTVEQVTVVD